AVTPEGRAEMDSATTGDAPLVVTVATVVETLWPGFAVPDDGAAAIENVPGVTGEFTTSEYVALCEPEVAVPVTLREYEPVGVVDDVRIDKVELPPEVTEA